MAAELLAAMIPSAKGDAKDIALRKVDVMKEKVLGSEPALLVQLNRAAGKMLPVKATKVCFGEARVCREHTRACMRPARPCALFSSSFLFLGDFFFSFCGRGRGWRGHTFFSCVVCCGFVLALIKTGKVNKVRF